MEKNLKSFNNPLHHFIWKQIVNLVPLERSTASILDDTLKKSCNDLFSYISNAFEDIYMKHDLYCIDTTAKVDGKIEDRVCFHRFILELIIDSALDTQNDFIIISKDVYEHILKKLNDKWKQNKVLPSNFTFEDQLETLKRHGMNIKQSGEDIVISNTVYPDMFLAAKLLYQANVMQYQKTKRTSQSFILCDFKAINDFNRKLQLDDVLDPLRDEEKELINKIIDYFSNKKISLKSENNFFYYRFAKFKYKKSDLFFVRWNSHHYAPGFELGLCLPYPGSNEYELFRNRINELENAELIKDFCVDNIRPCTFCNPNCVKNNAYKNKWLIFDRPLNKLISSCGGALVTIMSVDNNTFENVKILLDIYIQIIDFCI